MTSTDVTGNAGRSRARSRALRVLAVALSLAALPHIALAQKEPTAQDVATARDLFKEGRALEGAGDLKGALEKFKAAHALGRTPVTGIELAKTYAALNMPVEAREVCLGIERTGVAPEETQRSQHARKEASQLIVSLQSKIALLTLVVKGAPAGTDPIVKVDGAQVPAVALSSARSLDPGDHTVVASVADGPETKLNVSLKEGESKTLEVVVTVPVVVAPIPSATGTVVVPPPPPPPPPEGKKSVLVPIGVGVGITGVVVGLVTGAIAVSKRNALNSECSVTGGCLPGQGQDDLNSGRTFGNASTVSFIVGGVGVGMAIVGIMMKKSPASQPTATNGVTVEPLIGLGIFGAHGRF